MFRRSSKKLLESIRRQSDEIEALLPSTEVLKSEVSLWSVGDQLEHILLSNQLILRQMSGKLTQEPEKGKPLNFKGRFVLLFGRFPRGVGKAPEFAKPKGASKEELKEMLNQVNALIEKLSSRHHEIDASLYAFPHFVFGLLDARQWLRLSEVHTRHHLSIIADILR